MILQSLLEPGLAHKTQIQVPRFNWTYKHTLTTPINVCDTNDSQNSKHRDFCPDVNDGSALSSASRGS